VTEEGRLADGTVPASPADLLRHLEGLGVAAVTVEHPPVFTVDEAKRLRGEIPGAHVKNLFLRDRKGRRMWLVVCLEDRAVDLADLAGRIGADRLSFGSADRLMTYLGVIPGAVTPFAVINDHGGAVQVVLDQGLREVEPWSFHPLDNGMTTTLDGEGLVRFLESVGHPPRWVEFPPPE